MHRVIIVPGKNNKLQGRVRFPTGGDLLRYKSKPASRKAWFGVNPKPTV